MGSDPRRAGVEPAPGVAKGRKGGGRPSRRRAVRPRPPAPALQPGPAAEVRGTDGRTARAIGAGERREAGPVPPPVRCPWKERKVGGRRCLPGQP